MGDWDAAQFRQRMAELEIQRDAYARELGYRLRRGQSNGSAFVRATALGEAFAYGSLAASVATASPATL